MRRCLARPFASLSGHRRGRSCCAFTVLAVAALAAVLLVAAVSYAMNVSVLSILASASKTRLPLPIRAPLRMRGVPQMSTPGLERKHLDTLSSMFPQPASADLNQGHVLGVVVPFRRAEKELAIFLPYMSRFLRSQGVQQFQFYIVNQVDNFRFNRGLLLNIGMLHAEKDGCDYVALHDVDLLPQNPRLSYMFPSSPRHLAAPWLHPKYHYHKFIGGIFLISVDQFRRVNGLATSFWGWGREDDEFYKRLQDAKLTISRPADLVSDSTNTFIHEHDDDARPRDTMKSAEQKRAAKQRDTVTGLSTTEDQHILKKRRSSLLNGVYHIFLDVELKCDVTQTPWCLAPKECEPGYYRKPIPDDPEGRWVCKRCVYRCRPGFRLVGNCTQYEQPQCEWGGHQ